MALFIGVHTLAKKMGPRDVKKGWGGYKRAARKMGLTPISVSYSTKKRAAWCLTKARSKSEVARAHRRVLVPLKDIIEVKTLT